MKSSYILGSLSLLISVMLNTLLSWFSQGVQEMSMSSTSLLNIKWILKGKPKSLVAGIGGDVIIKVNSQFTLNQISGQVIEHKESWDLSASSAIAQAYFWSSRRLFSTVEFLKDLTESTKNLSSRFQTEKENTEIYPDPLGDPTKVPFSYSPSFYSIRALKNIYMI